MLKLLRNLVLAAILLAGALKLLAWYAVGNDADRIVQALAPFAQIKYDSLSTGLDGSVTVNRPSLTQGADHRVYRADSVSFETPGLFWLLKHSLLHENEWPATLRVSAKHLQVPPVAWVDPELFDATTLVPFAAAGCDVTALVSADYRRMGLSDVVMDAQLDYRFQPEMHSLDVTAQASTGGFSALALHAELHPFDLSTLTSAPMWQKLHAGQVSVNFTDQGFLLRRNQFCAQKTSVTADEFVTRHLAAAQTLLSAHHVEPSNEVFALYRNLVARGGEVSALSLPRTTFALADWRNGSPDDTLRQLNITARYRETPPVMLRLTFTQPATAPADETQTAVAAAPPEPAPIVVKPPPNALVPVVAAAVPSISEPPKLPTPAKPSDNMGLHDLDRVEAKLAPKPAPAKPVATELIKPATTEDDSKYASEPPPPPNSTLALAWKPGIERLPAKTPGKREYEVIDYANLGGVIGQRVRLITDGEKRIEGYLIGADSSAVRLRVGRADGDAQFEVPKKRIQQIQLVRRQPLD
jgi:hypothetical protein